MGRVDGAQIGEFPQPQPQPQPGIPMGTPNYQGVGQQPVPNIGNSWSTGLFDCHLDQTNAVMTAILPCITFAQIAEVLDEGQTTCAMATFMYILTMPVLCSNWILGSSYRAKLRRNYNLVEAPYTDAVSHIFCPCCSLCQEFRELQKRDLNPALGWNGILAQRNQVIAPPQDQFMYK